MSIESLKEQARSHEQDEEWGQALDLYLEAIRELDHRGEQDISLYNRVGDLEVRVGRVDRAVEHYERAVDLYMESELPNNAIAVCKKVVRNLPRKHSIYLKMGQIRARQGFLTDARQNFLTYAEREQAAGDLEEAFRALIEFVELAPGDIEIRLALASQLAGHERTDEAVEQFREARRRLILEGRDDEAEEVADRILELEPEAALDDAAAIRAAGEDALTAPAQDPEWGLTTLTLDDEEETGDGPDAAAGGAAGGGDAAAEPAAPPAPDERAGEAPEEADEEADPLPTLDDGPAGEEEEEAAPLPFMTFDDDAEEEETAAGPADTDEALESTGGNGTPDADEARESAVEEAVSEARREEPPETESAAEQEEREARPDQAEDVRKAEAAPEADAAPEAEAAAPGEPERLRAEGERLLAEGSVEDGWSLLERAHRAFADRGEPEEAVAVVRSMAEQRPDDVELRQRMVEYAYGTRDDEMLVSTYLDLARTLRRTGDPARARTVYQQVLDTDPDNQDARDALDRLAEETGAGSGATDPSEVASSEEYVDLGSMILDEEESEQSTRFVVPAEAPTGDQEADFANMLSQFKEKVAENVSGDDVSAHYDLGTAYKEMGLVDEAIGEFQAALRAARDHLATYEMLGQCFLEQDQPAAAVRILNRALDTSWEVEDELLGIYYYLGRAHETSGDEDTAVDFYEKVFSLDINFMDVTERLRALR